MGPGAYQQFMTGFQQDVLDPALQLFDVKGRPVESLVNRVLQPGEYKVAWSASGMPSGVYFAELVSGNYRQVQKLVLMK